MKWFSYGLLIFVFFKIWCVYSAQIDEEGTFSGRIARVTEAGKIIRLKVDFLNMKYLNKGDKIEFWDEKDDRRNCKSYIIGKSNDYLLIRISDFKGCAQNIYLVAGAYLKLFSPDLVNNLKMGKELLKILEKKRLAIGGRLGRTKEALSQHMSKVEAVNDRYTVLREQLENEWREELTKLEEDNLVIKKQYSALELALQDIDRKMERYQIEDENLRMDRWALDSKLYFKK
ncbi:MAG: hypothetical protein A2381_17810 [Bdellovibrionales bacterium RIFOXYB1_FULL_37_110]|nr:MAG: hypothetical protein A2417_08600 [Bdellovibrionales bacterium RIFOXYC1_FULL_37_79]OFZ59828.1 MAG: hypothetical protein A2381_17810 [Bdellovibrionales bacterium RIFOXYB1_FULL_37_110]OFZ65442.1 MAG: hypothetical protein A2577_18345 [Bdellovibrionales bacterium RIFOXYD1_FULL_36_51]OFZ67222.1 MAG: hypothetical protein A2328_04985 [Bdellovibrionales bacterium RIFOXYB2_FULL_36_6]